MKSYQEALFIIRDNDNVLRNMSTNVYKFKILP